MKRTLSVVLCAALLASLASCSEAAEKTDSKDSQKSRLQSTAENIDYTTLDTTWECDYLKLNINSNWEKSDYLSGDLTLADWNWSDKENEYHFISFTIRHDSTYKKLTQSEMISSFKNSKSLILNDDEFKNDSIMLEEYEGVEVADSFVKNGQAYIVLNKSGSNNRRIKFQGESFSGEFRYDLLDEQTVLNIIDTIVFY